MDAPLLNPTSASASEPISPAPAGSQCAPALSAVARLPPELLVLILHHLLALHSSPPSKQSAAQRFLRVSRSFNAAFLLSDAGRERAVQSDEQALRLTEWLTDNPHAQGRVKKLWVVLWERSDLTDRIVAGLVRACAAGLESCVWDFSRLSGVKGRRAPGRLLEAWTMCGGLREFTSMASRDLSGGEVQALLAAWPSMEVLQIEGSSIDLSWTPLHTSPPTAWTVPTRLRSVSLFLANPDIFACFSALANASSQTLTHLDLDFAFTPSPADLALCFTPLQDTLLSLTLRDATPAGLDYEQLSVTGARFTRLKELSLPAAFIADEGRRERTDSIGRLEVLSLTAWPPGAGLDDILAVLEGEKPPRRLRLSRAWWAAAQVDMSWGHMLSVCETCERLMEAKGVKLEWIDD